MKILNTFLKLLVCILHALFMLAICWIWQNIDYTLDIEESIVEKTSILERTLMDKNSSETNDFVFIDVSGIKKLLPREDKSGTEAITDRKKLADFFNIINKVGHDNYQYILCDILFKRSSPDDDALKKAFEKTQKIILPYTIADKEIVPGVFTNTLSGFVAYHTSSGYWSSGTFVKYNLISKEGLKGLPVILLEKLQKKKIIQHHGFIWIDEKPALNNMIVDFRIRNTSLTDNEGHSKIIPFDDMLALLQANKEAAFREFLADKIIVIGDFEDDMHPTVFGDMPGPIILTNIYLSLKHGDNMITTGLLLYLFFFFYIISWLIIYPPPFMKRLNNWSENLLIGFGLTELFISGMVVWLISIGSYLFFRFHINVIPLTLYITLISTIKEYLKKRKEKLEKINTNCKSASS